MRALCAFDAAARHLSFSRAAREMGTQQPAVSRWIAELEHEIGIQLFERGFRPARLTPSGELFHRAVTVSLERIAAGALAAASLSDTQRVIVACGYGTSHQFLLPRFEALCRAIGEDVCLRVLTVDYHMLDRLGSDEIDLVLTYGETADASEGGVALFAEAVTPVCSPDFAAAHAQVLARPVAEWGSLPFLRLDRPSPGWATWHDWFESAAYPLSTPRYVGFHDYVYLLEAAVAGQGLALGWRYYIDRYMDERTLVAVTDSFVERDRYCFARLTARGHRRPAARRCLDALCALTNEAAPSRS